MATAKRTTGGSSTRNENIPELPAGPQFLRCYGVYHVGHRSSPFKEGAFFNDIYLMFETLNHQTEFYEGKGKQPYNLNHSMNFSINEKSNYSAMLESWFGINLDQQENFDTRELLGKVCQATIVIQAPKNPQKKAFPKISSIQGIVPGTPLPEVEQPNALVYYDVEEHGLNTEEFVSMPSWIRKKAVESYEGRQLQEAGMKPWHWSDQDKEMKKPASNVNISDIIILEPRESLAKKAQGGSGQPTNTPPPPVQQAPAQTPQQASTDVQFENGDLPASGVEMDEL